MQKIMKRSLALLLAVVLCFSAMPISVFATEIAPDNVVSSEAPPSEEPVESSQPESTPEPDASPAPEESSPEPSGTPAASAEPTAEPSAEPTEKPETSPSPSAEPSTEPDESETPSGTELPITRIWPTAPRKARAASFGTDGVLYMGDECCPGGVGTPPTLGKYVGTMSVIAMKYGGRYVAGYCLEQARFVP